MNITYKNEGVVSGIIEDINKLSIPTKTGGSFSKWVVVIAQEYEYNGNLNRRTAVVEYPAKNEIPELTRAKTGDHITCRFRIEARHWEKDGRSGYMPSIIGFGEIKLQPWDNKPRDLELTQEMDQDVPF